MLIGGITGLLKCHSVCLDTHGRTTICTWAVMSVLCRVVVQGIYYSDKSFLNSWRVKCKMLAARMAISRYSEKGLVPDLFSRSDVKQGLAYFGSVVCLFVWVFVLNIISRQLSQFDTHDLPGYGCQLEEGEREREKC